MTSPPSSVTKPGTVIEATRLRARISGSGWDTSGRPVRARLLDRGARPAGPRLAVAGQEDLGLDALEAVERGERLCAGDVEGARLDLRPAAVGQRVPGDDLVAHHERAMVLEVQGDVPVGVARRGDDPGPARDVEDLAVGEGRHLSDLRLPAAAVGDDVEEDLKGGRADQVGEDAAVARG